MKSLVIWTLPGPLLLTHIERGQDKGFGLLDPRARRCAQTYAQQRSVGVGK